MKLFKRIKNKIKGGLKLHHRMILIYIIGGVIPFISANIYTNVKNQANLIALNKSTQKSEVAILKKQISESMVIATDVINELYINEDVVDITNRRYNSISAFENDCDARLGIIDRYLNYYKRDICG